VATVARVRPKIVCLSLRQLQFYQPSTAVFRFISFSCHPDGKSKNRGLLSSVTLCATASANTRCEDLSRLAADSIRAAPSFTNLSAWVTFAFLRTYRTRMEENLVAALGERSAHPMNARRWFGVRGKFCPRRPRYHRRDAFFQRKNSRDSGSGRRKTFRASPWKGPWSPGFKRPLGKLYDDRARLAAGGFPFSVVVKQPRDRRFARLIDAYRAQLGIHTISAKPRREAVRGILKALRENRIVLVIADEFSPATSWWTSWGKISCAARAGNSGAPNRRRDIADVCHSASR